MIDLSGSWARLGINVLVGTVAGGITNAVAVWMLFHPYERRYGLHGAIPKNKARLAKSIGRVVGERLLTPGDIVAELQRAGLRESLDAKLTEFIATLLDREWGSLRDILPAPVTAELARTLAGLGPSLAEGYLAHVQGPAFEARVRAFIARARVEMTGLPLRGMLTPERRADLAARAADLAAELIDERRNDEERSTRAKLGDLLIRLAGTERTRSFVERTVGDALARAEARTWGDILVLADDDAIAQLVLDGARSAQAAEMALAAAGGAAAAVLDKPAGRLGRFLPADASARLAAVARPALWDWIVAQLPDVLATLDVETMVERKVLGFSTQRVEEIVRNVTQKELDLIVNLGYVLGAVIGLVTFAVGEMVRLL